MLPTSIDKCWYRCEDSKDLSDEQIKKIISKLTLTDTISSDLADQFFNHGHLTKNREKIYAGINKYLWDKYGFRYCGKADPNLDALERGISQVRDENIETDMELQVSNKIDWNEGDFGDPSSCYFTCNTVTRLVLNELENFRTIKFWRDGKGFGRALILDEIFPNAFLVYNSYPGHKTASYLDFFTEAFKSVLSKQLGVPLESHKIQMKLPAVTQERGSQWFYANSSGSALLVYPHDNLEAKAKKEVLIDLGIRPHIESFEEYLGMCDCCGEKPVCTDVSYSVLQHPNIADLYLCHSCTKKLPISHNCHNCKTEVCFRDENLEIQVHPEFGKQVIRRDNGAKVPFCTKCFNERDTHKFYAPALDRLLGNKIKKPKVSYLGSGVYQLEYV